MFEVEPRGPQVEEEYGYGDEAAADDDDGDPKEHVSGGHMGGTSTLSHAELDLAPPSPTGGATGKLGHNAPPPSETGDPPVVLRHCILFFSLPLVLF